MQAGRSYWAWTAEEWATLIGRDQDGFRKAGPALADDAVRPCRAAHAFLLGGFTAFCQLASRRRHHPMRRRLPLLPQAGPRPRLQRPAPFSDTAGSAPPQGLVPGRPGAFPAPPEPVAAPSACDGLAALAVGKSSGDDLLGGEPSIGSRVMGRYTVGCSRTYRCGRLKVFRAARSSAATPSTTPIQHEVLPVGRRPGQDQPGLARLLDNHRQVAEGVAAGEHQQHVARPGQREAGRERPDRSAEGCYRSRGSRLR